MPRRRDVTAGLAALLLQGCAAILGRPPSAAASRLAPGFDGALYIPGYKVRAMRHRGRPALQSRYLTRNLPRGYDGPMTLLTRLGADGGLAQAIFPVTGHDVAIDPATGRGVMASMEGAGFCSFDAATLDLVALGRHGGDMWGGGHALILPGGALALTERAPNRGWTGRMADHLGRLTLHDPATLAALERYPAGGIAPHEVRLMADGTHVAIANYGSTWPAGGQGHALPRHTVAPSVTVLSLASGRVVARHANAAGAPEIRHLAVTGPGRFSAVQVALTAAGRGAPGRPRGPADRSGGGRHGFRSVPLLSGGPGGLAELRPPPGTRPMLEGLSIEYDPQHGQVIASFPASNQVVIVDAAAERVAAIIDTEALGLEAPCGVALLGGSPFYAVAGYHRRVMVFERGTHRPRRELGWQGVIWGHSHMVAA